MKHRTLFISALIALFPEIGRAGTVAIGLLSFDVFIPSSVTPPVPGINALNLLNATGPTFGGLLGSPFRQQVADLPRLHRLWSPLVLDLVGFSSWVTLSLVN